MSTAPVIVAPPPPAWLPHLDPEFQVKFLKKNGDLHWASNMGPQTWTLLCPYDEVLIGGRRGGSKSAALIAWMAMGDPSLSDDDPAKLSYLNEPSFRALILREEYQSMAEFIDEAHDFFRPFGVKATGGASQPVVFEFKSGAKIYTGHLGNKEAFNKSKGWGLTKIGIEELTQIPEQSWYLKLFGALRNKKQFRIHGNKQFPALRAQIMSTTNPDGCGHIWVKKRFVKVPDQAGNQIPWNTPMRDSITGLIRIFIPMRLEDNPYLRENKQYLGMLMAQDEVTRKQWMEGDWDAGVGQFFTEFRAHGPISDEERDKYPWARHVVPSADLKPWWYRWGSLDIGYDHPSVGHKFCRNESERRLHVYDELAVRQVGAFELGVLLAKWWLPDLETLPDHQVTLYLSPDAFNKTDATKTRAEQIEHGIKEVLGPYGAFLLKYNEDERAAMARDPKAAALMFERRRSEMAGRGMCIAIKAANNDRVAGWSYIRDLLRFRPILAETEAELKQRLQDVFQRAGVEAYEKELSRSTDRKPEILPAVQIWKQCTEAIRGLQEAMRDDPPRNEDVRKWDAVEGVGGDDGLDSLRYGCMSYREIATQMPKSYWVEDRMASMLSQHEQALGSTITDPTRLAMIRATQAARYEKQHAGTGGGGSITLPRASSHRWRN